MTNSPLDPSTEAAIRRQLAEAPSAAEEQRAAERQQSIPAGHAWARAGNCPRCGAPIWFLAVAPASDVPPQHFFTCPCTQRERMSELERMRADQILKSTNGAKGT